MGPKCARNLYIRILNTRERDDMTDNKAYAQYLCGIITEAQYHEAQLGAEADESRTAEDEPQAAVEHAEETTNPAGFARWLADRDVDMLDEMVASPGLIYGAYDKGGLHKLQKIVDNSSKLYSKDPFYLDYVLKKLIRAQDDPQYHSPVFLKRFALELDQNFSNMPSRPLDKEHDDQDVADKVHAIVHMLKRIIFHHGQENVKGLLGQISGRAEKEAEISKKFNLPGPVAGQEDIAKRYGVDIGKLRRASATYNR